MILAECPKCNNWQAIGKKLCNKCEHVFKTKLVYVIRVHGKCKRHPNLSLPEIRALEANLKIQPPQEEEMRLSALFDLYVGYLDNKGSWSGDARRMTNEMAAYFKNIPVSQLKRHMVLYYRGYLTQKAPRYHNKPTISNRTVNAYMQCGRAAYNYADPAGHNPFRALGRLPEPIVEEYLSPEEETRLLLVAKTRLPWLYQFICISLGTGLRRSNVLNLKRSEVDFERKTISVIQKGGRRFTTRLDEMTELVLQSIPKNGSDYFLVNPKTGNPYAAIRPAFLQCQQLAGIKKPIRVHGLRHQVGYKLAAQGCNLKQIMEVLGHSQLSTTARYLALSPDNISQVKKGLEIKSVMADFVSGRDVSESLSQKVIAIKPSVNLPH
jgi:integrase